MVTYCLSKLTILYVDNDLESQKKYEKILTKHVKKVIVAKDGEEGVSLYKEFNPDIVITDTMLPILNGIEMIKVIKNINPVQTIIIKTDKSHTQMLFDTFDLYVDGYILNTDSEEKFISKINYIAEKCYLRNSNIEKRKILQNILDHQSALTILTDFKTISYVSKSFLDFFNFNDKNDFFDRFDTILDIFMKHDNFLHANDKDEFLHKFKESKAIKKIVLMLSIDFNPKAFHIYIDKVKDSELYIINLSNITISQELNVEMSQKVYLDGLTGVNNRNKFEEFFSYEFTKFERDKEPFSICILDVDFFKKFNDIHGHLIGDEVLIMLANEINNNTRKSDLFARWGGEEFVLLFSQTSEKNAKDICEGLRKKVEQLNHKTAGGITCSFGVSQVKENDTLEMVFERCDKALYVAKKNGRNRVCIL